jgi:glutamate-ammonia-ligase adenylyltransferase
MRSLDVLIDQALMDRVLIDQSVDPQRVAQYWRDFQAKNPGRLAQLEQHPERVQWLSVIFSCSRFLSEELLRHPEWLESISDLDFALTRDDYCLRMLHFLEGRESALDLALFRRHELVRIVLRDRLEMAPLSEITQEISNLADAILDGALTSAKKDVESRYGAPLEEADDSGKTEASLCVLALGKTGWPRAEL